MFSEQWGLIPTFLNEHDPRPVSKQFNEAYVSGRHPFKGFTFDPETLALKYPGDPAMKPLETVKFRDETIHLYPSAWVLIVQPDGKWEVCRMD